MTAGRVALVGLPDLLREIVTGVLAGQPDLMVVRMESNAEQAIERLGANVLVVSEGVLDGAAVSALLQRHPDVPVIGISADGRQAYARIESRRVPLGGLSPEALSEAIRSLLPGNETA